MKIIFSRKGFDSPNGRPVPSPIFPDRYPPYPCQIPQSGGPTRYGDVQWARGEAIGPIVESLTQP